MRTNKKRFATLIATCTVAGLTANAGAQEDPTATGGGKKPFVLVVIDSSASMEWTTEGDDRYPWYDRHTALNVSGDGVPDEIVPGVSIGEYKISNDVEMDIDITAPNEGPMAFGPCVMWEPIYADTGDVQSACQDYTRPSWRPRTPTSWGLAQPYTSWHEFPVDGSGTLMGPRMWDYMRGDYLAGTELLVTGGRLQDARQPRHVTIKEAMTGQMILLPKNIDVSNGIDISSYNPQRFGPGCWLVPRQRDASAIPSDDSSYCLSPTREEYANFWHYPDYNQPIPHFQEVYDGQLRDGVMDRLGSNVIFAFAAFDGYRDDANNTDTDADGDVDLRVWNPNYLNDSIDGSSPTSMQSWRTSTLDGTALGEGTTPCNGVNAPCYNLGLYRVVTPTNLSIPATFFPQISAYTQIALNDTGFLNEQGGNDFKLSPKEGESRARAFLGTTFSKGFDKYIREFELGRQPIARATPLAAVMHDAYQFFGNGEAGADPIGDDEFAECRPKHIVLLSDGSPEPERGEASLEGLAFGYDKDRYIYGTTELEVQGMVQDVDGMLLPTGDPVAENDYGLRVHAIGLNIGQGDSDAIKKLAGIAIEGNSCAQVLLGKDYVPNTISGGACNPDTQVCLVDQSAEVSAYLNGGSYTWARPGTTDTFGCSGAPAFILNTNDPAAISTVLFRMFSELLASSGLSSRTRAVVANRLDQVDATDNFVIGGQYRLYSGVKIGGSDWWKGVINRLTLPCDGTSPPQKSLDDEVGTQVTLENDPQDSRRIWTVVPHAQIYDFLNERPREMGTYVTDSAYPMNFRLHEVDDGEDEFQGTYLTDLPGAATNILGTRVPFRRAQLQKAYAPVTNDAIAYLNGLNAADGNEVGDIVNSFRGRVDARVSRSSDGTSADSRAIGGILNSNPVVVGPPELDLPIGSYREFRARYADRLTMLYVSSMDGLLHALYTGEGDVAKRAMTVEGNLPGANDVDTVTKANEQREAWAYMPFMMQRELSSNANSQAYLSDGTPVVKDVRLCDQNPTKNANMQACRAICSGTNCNSFPASYQWRTVLVQGRGLAGTGYFAMDVTRPGGRNLADLGGASMENPDPIALWEFDSTWERAQVAYLMGTEPKRVSSGVNPPDSLWNNTECGNDVNNFWKGSFLGFSTSEPEIATLLVDHPQGKAQRPVAVFGGGVATADGVSCGDAASGLAIYVVDLQTGSLLRRFTSYFDASNTEHHFGDSPVPAETFYADPGAGYFAGAPALFDAASGAIATRGFIGDSRGRMFRMDFLSSDPVDWKVEMFFDPYSDADLRQSFTDAGFANSEAFGPASYKPAISLTPRREIMVVYGTGEPGDAVANQQGQAIIALTENLEQKKGVLAWAEVFGDGEKLTGEPVIFDRNVYFPTYAIPPDDSCAPGTARIWGLKLVDQDINTIEPSGSFEGNADITTNGLLADPEATATRPPRWFGPVDPTLIRGVTITLGPQCAVTGSGTDDPTISSRAPQRPQLIAQTAGNIDADLKNADDLSGTPPLNNIDRLVLDLPVPRTQSIPLSWSIVTN